ncbi:MAG TPA: hypothetical protein VHL08_04200 [Dongiaceae bacterium]|jgi:glucan 1,3-beta-glucosidase|nr:hypothetical protein [Dongiaceae bacterium]
MRQRTRLLGAALLAALLAAALWAYLGWPRPLPDARADRISCVSYTPFRGDETPFDETFVASATHIREDLVHLKSVTSCVRLYAVDQGLDQVLPIAQELGMQVLMGIWIGREPLKNEQQIRAAIALAQKYHTAIRAIIVGNEVLLRGEQRPEWLAGMIRQVKQATGLPVTYADVWEYWLRAPMLVPEVDFITIHVLPYWEDEPVPAERGVAHVAAILEEVQRLFPGKRIMIGETGYPSAGRARGAAVPSRYAEALFAREFLSYAETHRFDYNFIEAFDQPWKRLSEGTVGGYWGFFDSTRMIKTLLKGPVSNYPDWPAFAFVSGTIAAALVLGRKRSFLTASALGFLLPLQFAHSWIAWRDWGEFMIESVLALLSILMLTLPPSSDEGALRLPVTLKRGSQINFSHPRLREGLYLAALLGTGIVTLGLLFDPRYRDFPLAAFAIPAIIFGGQWPRLPGDHIMRWAICGAALVVAIKENLGPTLNLHALAWTVIAVAVAAPFANRLTRSSDRRAGSSNRTISPAAR